jgi:hypothetical protein
VKRHYKPVITVTKKDPERVVEYQTQDGTKRTLQLNLFKSDKKHGVKLLIGRRKERDSKYILSSEG